MLHLQVMRLEHETYIFDAFRSFPIAPHQKRQSIKKTILTWMVLKGAGNSYQLSLVN